ncbi:MAG: DUF6273 domain-containing protein [Bacilli bacterium]|nr:DUF6273 domain-containing protein [Bacilli bacterium]
MKKIMFVMPLMVVSLLANCNNKKQWYQDSNFINSLTKDDVGLEKEVEVNGLKHKVRLIDVDHDNLTDKSGKAHTTWEFANLISDKNGYSLATVWNFEKGTSSNNYDFLNSNLRKAIDGGGNAQLCWYRKDETKATQDSEYKNKSVLDMLPSDLKAVLKEVVKEIAVGNNYEVRTYNTKLFPLSYQEMIDTIPEGTAVAKEGFTYKFYQGDDVSNKRIKWQIKHHDGASIKSTKIEEKDWDLENYAGVNMESDPSGGYSFTRSPHTGGTGNVMHYITNVGEFNSSQIYGYANSVAPAFCI